MPARRPVIGLNLSVSDASRPPAGSVSIGLAYVDAIEGAGGVPLLFPPYRGDASLALALQRVDGFCFIGGPDYDPAPYGGRVQKAEELMDARRDRFDRALARRVLEETALPVLGVCGGHQLIALARGGALTQDVRTEWRPVGVEAVLPHAGADRSGAAIQDFRHRVRLEPGSLAARATGQDAELATNSFHHQAVRPDRVGEGLRVSAWAADGVPEAIEPAPASAWARAGRFVLGVQWHPERLPEESAHQNIFRALVEAAGGRRG